MGDPICKWRNASIWTTVELVSQLPKKSMSNKDFRLFMQDSIYGNAFLRTACQTTCQLGLYYINDRNMYIPRFDHDISEQEASIYLHKWITRYYVPNPYTVRKFDKMKNSVILMYAIAEFVEEYPHLSNLKTACDAIFGEETGNLLCVKYILNEYSNIMEIDSEFNIKLLQPTSVEPLVWNKRYDKKAFFEFFN